MTNVVWAPVPLSFIVLVTGMYLMKRKASLSRISSEGGGHGGVRVSSLVESKELEQIG